MAEKLGLVFNLDVPVVYDNGSILKEIELVRINGAAEKLFLDKLPEKPYTWIANVIAASVRAINGNPVANPARMDYVKDGYVKLPQTILQIPIATSNTILIEVHRRLWKNEIKNQECLCKYCGSKNIIDIDLSRLAYDDKTLEKISSGNDWLTVTANLEDGWEYFAPMLPNGSQNPLAEYNGLNFNRFKFRAPTLGDAIRSEDCAQDTVLFWRKIAYDCLISVETEDGMILPSQAYVGMGLKLYNEILYKEDLSVIRETLRDEIPTFPYAYQENCYKCKRDFPVSMEGNGFFSD